MREPRIEQAASDITAELVKTAREPVIDKLKQALDEIKQLKEQVFWLLSDLYFAEFRAIDGLKQHPQGLTFDEWRLLRSRRKESEKT